MTSPVGPESLGPSPPRPAVRCSMSVVGNGADSFITINCSPRGKNPLALPETASAIKRSLVHQ